MKSSVLLQIHHYEHLQKEDQMVKDEAAMYVDASQARETASSSAYTHTTSPKDDVTHGNL